VLVPLASAGQYGALLRDMPPMELDSPLEAARVFSTREPKWVDSLHLPGSSEKAEGTGRWRDMITMHSYAVLPLILHGEAIGVLTLQWSAPIEFTPALQTTLESVATVVALAVANASRPAAEEASDEDAEPPHRCLETLDVTVFGAPRDEGGTEPETVLCASVEVCGSGELIFAHAEPEDAPARLLLMAPQSACSEIPPTARSVASTVVNLSGAPQVWLEMLNRELAGLGCGLQAWAAAFDPVTGALIEATAGVVSTLTTSAAGTEEQSEHRQLPVGLWSEEAYAERARLLLPGDTFEVALEDGPDVTLVFHTRAPKR
jgi:hypothetical protein